MNDIVHDIAFINAKYSLSQLVLQLAKDTINKVGFSWYGTPAAPDNYLDLLHAYKMSKETGAPLPISSLYCDKVIYDDPETNVAMRFWHDTSHVINGLNFTPEDELDLGLWHLKKLTNYGVKKGTLVYRMLEVDLLGQNYLQAVARRFPLDQSAFVWNCLNMGLHEGVALEVKKSREAS